MANFRASADHARTTGEEALAHALALLAQPTPAKRRLPLPDDGLVYFIQAGENGPIKIGTTTNLRMRVKKLQQAQAEKLAVRALRKGGVATERKYHARFKAHHKRGEWFNPAPEILAEIERLQGEVA
ncbi:GIY-YIG nuclease family protein [Novosphingobium sp. JCM 18896]|uniref:GIY-YIG nuclease family protein n=1 Tax=Novosphingobium sp. JCM 18896 TaxID=2989731 RepID=UPI002221E11C|nr:GIY-YIG nuclease family protein [Novosphingobium sp. JCM 18896]MCW1431424.1 GIY-YIG nuclease family protein [Novosphingobium sp. JCM 18896]